jgi:hypothetical protein
MIKHLMMNYSRKFIFALFFGLFLSLTAKADPQLPEPLMGYYKDQNDRLVVLQRDFFYLEDIMSKSGYYQAVEPQTDGSYQVYIRQHANQSRLLELNLLPIDGGLMAVLKDYSAEELALKPFEPAAYKRSGDDIFPMSNGKWYCGEDDQLVEIANDLVSIDDATYRLVADFQVIDDQQLRPYFLLESDYQQQFIARGLQLNEHYFGWNILGRYYEYCRRDIHKPYGKSEFYEDLPISLVGNWESTTPEKTNISFYPDYTFSRSKEKAKIKRFTYLPTKDAIHFEVALGKDRILWSIQPVSENELQITELSSQQTTTYLRTSEVADFVGNPEIEVEQVPFLPWAIGVAMGLIIAIIVILRTRNRNQRKKEFV